MKKILVLLAFMLTLNAGDFTIKRESGKTTFSFSKENGVYTLSNKKTFDDNVKVIIIYEDESKKEAIEDKYALRNGKNKYDLYYIYEQNSSNLVKLFEDLSKEKAIKTVHPNWTTHIKKF
ncbi:MAG: hypothetical protein KGV43_03100 [Arcobacter sp.]|nr:hypothetical protein [Arcobacter sp.]